MHLQRLLEVPRPLNIRIIDTLPIVSSKKIKSSDLSTDKRFMKVAMIFILMIFGLAHTSLAQVTTGGVAAHYKLGLLVSGTKIEELNTHLKDRDKECSGQNRLKKNDDLINVYLKLSLYKQAKKTDCDEMNKYFQCLNDEKSKLLIQAIKENKFSNSIIMSKYEIGEAESQIILDFFFDLEKSEK